MYMDKQVKRGYNEYIRLDEGIGKDAMMDVALLVMEDGDTWSCEDPEKEVAALVFDGKCTIKWENESYDVDRPNPFDYNPSCLHVCKGVKFEIIAHGPCNIYIQKTLNEKTFPSKMYKPEDTDTWARGNKGELMGCIKRDVRTCFDLDNAPYSNMVLGEVVNLPGKWSSYPPHHHPQPECYFYRFDKPMGFGAGWGNIVCEVAEGKVGELSIPYTVLGEVTDKGVFEYGNTVITMDEALAGWMKTLEDVFPTVTGKEKTGEAARVEEKLYDTDTIYICDHKLAQPEVFIPVFPGTNCEYDSTKAFERAGAKVVTKVFKNLSAQDIRESVEEYKKEIAKAQIIMFPGGFSAGDEPDGSAKFFATVFRNAVIKEEVEKLLNERDGLMLGICNGFQALIKLGLVPEGKITEQKPDSPTLAMNTIGRHISKMVYTKVMTNKSPWLAEAKLGGVYCNPASHGEGRFVADEAWLHRLIANGQVATQYVDDKGNVTMDEYWNPNGSYMAIEGITSPDGRILGKMAHSERRGEAVAMNIYGEQDMKIFESGVKYFK